MVSHAGYLLKEYVKRWLTSKGWEFKDFGTYSEESCDYPDFAHPLALAVESGECYPGIAVCGSGNGISMSDRRVGRMALTPEGLCGFEYDADWIRNGFSISPFYLPLKPGLVMAKQDPFGGNFGVFDDSLPDGWGNLLLDRYLQEKGIDPYKLNVLERLSLIGSTGRGALEYRPDKSVATDEEFLDFDHLAKEAENILKSKESTGSVDLFYKYGGSSGGARPKVFTKIDEREWLVKFKATSDPSNVGEIEYNYSILAKECGIRMAETRLFGNHYFGVERFDRTPQGKIHTASAAGLLHVKLTTKWISNHRSQR